MYKYKRGIKKQEEKQQALSQQSNDTKLHYYYDNNKIHFSISLFFAFWLLASVNWLFEDQEAPGVLLADILYYLGYASFGYFLYSLYYHFCRKEFEPFILILIAIIILVPLIFIVDTIVSTMRLLSTQTVDISLVIVNASYPVLDAIMIFPIVIIFWAVGPYIRDARMLFHMNKSQMGKVNQLLLLSSLVLLPYGYCYCL